MLRLKISEIEDRVTVAAILFKNGYSVTPVKEKPPGKKVNVYYIEIEKKGDNDVNDKLFEL